VLLLLFAVSACTFQQVSPVLYRGPVPNKSRMDELKEMGIKTIINLRTNPQRGKEAYARKIGLNFIHVPTGVFLAPDRGKVHKYVEIVRNPQYQPVYVCCTLGTDRTALYVGLYRVLVEDWSGQEAWEEMEAHHIKKWWPPFANYENVLADYEKLQTAVTASQPAGEPGTDQNTGKLDSVYFPLRPISSFEPAGREDRWP